MPCPFGYTAAQEGEEVDAGDEVAGKTDSAKKDKKDKDDVSWFYKNQMKADEEAKKHKLKKVEDSKQRLERIMASKRKQVEYNDDFPEYISIASSELSELDSDVHSLRSLRSCAESWIEDAGYKAPAEAWLKFAAPTTLAVIAFCLLQAHSVFLLYDKVSGNAVNKHWVAWSLWVALGFSVCLALLYYSASTRSKRLMLVTQVGLVAVYTVLAVMTAAMCTNPTQLDSQYVSATCASRSKMRSSDALLCKAIQAVGRDMASAFPWFIAGCVAMAVSAVTLASLGLWYVFELAFIEKKAAKHMKRHRHHKHRIPWHKIKVVGPVTNCGSGEAAAHGRKGAKSSGKCPMMH